MFSKNEIKLFKTACEINGVSGIENKVAKFLKDEYTKLGYQIIYDNLGSIYAYKKSKNPNAIKIMVDGHMDEIGFIVVSIENTGLIKLAPLGGLYIETLHAQRVLLTKRNGDTIEGVIDCSNLSNTNIKNVKADFGFANKDEAISNGVNIGDMVVVKGDLVVLNGGKRLMAKAFDDRYGLVLGLELAKRMKDKELPYDLYIGGSVQEEVGLRGAKTSSNLIDPDFAICLDCSPSNSLKGECGNLGDGVLLRYYDRSMIAFEELISLQEKAVKKAHVKSQYFYSMGGTNAGSVHMNDDGVLTLTHCICARNLHTNSTIIDSDDYHAAKKSLFKLLDLIDEKEIEKIRQWRRS